mgnify:CR=1 FL=1
MVASGKKLRIVAPIGKVPSADRDLHDRIQRLPREAEISRVFKEIGEWEETAVKKFKEQEHTTKSGKLVIICR